VPAIRAAKAATTQIPIVFALGTDPVQAGLVANLNRPGGNVTGISTMNLDLGSKWVGLLHELLPAAKRFAVLVNTQSPDSARSIIAGTQEAAFTLGMQIEIIFASNEGEIDTALAGLGTRSQALIIHPEVLFLENLGKLAALAIREKLPALYTIRNFPQAGGLMSWFELPRGASSGRRLCRSHPQRRKTRRAARPTGHQIRLGHQPQDRPRAWARRACYAARPRR
jgi:putative ABC transport system substrate-binding protein